MDRLVIRTVLRLASALAALGLISRPPVHFSCLWCTSWFELPFSAVVIRVHPWLTLLPLAALTTVFWIRCVDVPCGQAGALWPFAGYIWGYAETFYGTMSGPWWYHTATSVPRARNRPFSALRLLIQLTRKPPHQGNAEGRRQNAEFRQAPPMRHQCDIKATPKRVASQAVATPKPPSCDLKATLMRPSCVHKAPTKLPQSLEQDHGRRGKS